MEDIEAWLTDQVTAENSISDVSHMAAPANINNYASTDCEVRLQLLEGYWNGFVERNTLLRRAQINLDERPYFKQNRFAVVQEGYLITKARLVSRIRELTPPPTATTATQQQAPPVVTQGPSIQAMLEKLKLPSFAGHQPRWEPFKERFEALVINQTTDPVVRLARLMDCLSGEAADRLKGIGSAGSSFQTAWDTLCRRYDNKRLRFSLQMSALIDLPTAEVEDATHLSVLLNTVNESINTFKTLGRPTQHWDDVFVHFIESKLTATTQKDWVKAVEQGDGEFPKYETMKKFIEDRISTLDIIGLREEKANSSGHTDNQSTSKKAKSSAVHVAYQDSSESKATSKCSLCGANHFLSYCNQFSGLSQGKRKAHVMSAKLCFNCLNDHHVVENCDSKGRCQVCNAKHHTKLHQDRPAERSTACQLANVEEEAELEEQEASVNVATPADCGGGLLSTGSVLLSTACVTLQSANGQSVTVRALLDSGAEQSFLSEHIAQLLNLRRARANVVVSGVGASTAVVAKTRVNVTLKSALESNFSFEFSALILRRLTSLIPRQEVTQQRWPHLEGLQLADPHFGKPGRIDCILSSTIYAAVIREGVKRGPPRTPTALKSAFGWLLMGPTGEEPSRSCEEAAVLHASVDEELTAAVNRLWELEEIPPAPKWSPDEQACVAHFKTTHTRDEQGRFVVRLPFSKPPEGLEDSEKIAEACFKRLELRFKKHPELADQYKRFMDEYAQLHHMERVPLDQKHAEKSTYFPHHPVFKKNASKDIRVVFNASQKSAEGCSLNSFLHTGPKLQEDIFILISRWMFMPVVFTCDVVKMFRQLLVHPSDADWQRIKWRSSTEAPVEDWRLTTVTYGTACAPYLANACMEQLAEDESSRWPLGAELLLKSRYVDDFLAGGDTLQEAAEAGKQLVKILESAGMNVGKWAASDSRLLKMLGLNQEIVEETEIQEPKVTSTLGLKWISKEDYFVFKITPPTVQDKTTKRIILSEYAKLFDPMGWLEPVVVAVKILWQNLWLQGWDWDTPISTEFADAWRAFCEQLTELEKIRIPRWSSATKNAEWELHGFSDASERAYAVAIYIVVRSDAETSAKLIAAKSKVAPLQVISLPKLELCGATLLAKFIHYTIEKLDNKPSAIHCWTDSKIVLAWLKNHPSRWKTFVANRVSEINSTLPTATWRHVRSEDNPADLATRGLTPGQLVDVEDWWRGPELIRKSPAEWPLAGDQQCSTELESRSRVSVNVAAAQTSEEFSGWLCKFSSVDKMIRVIAYILRWRRNSHTTAEKKRKGWFTAEELAVAESCLLRLVQREVFQADIHALRKNGAVTSTSAIRRLSPYLDQQGLLRVGGRLQNSFLQEEEKHPIILPGRHHVTGLIIEKAHKVTLHGGPGVVQSSLLRRYWIVRGRNFIRGVVRKCVKCARHRATVIEQKMGPLPAVRLRPARVFTHTGVDFCGPFNIKASPGRGQKTYKGYAALFICMVVRAVHIEIVSDLTSAAFLAAFRRFTSRRGLCKTLYCDNATNFQGAEAELGRLFEETSAFSQEVGAAIARDRVEWAFIPPRAPNFGGLWEANIKSFKTHLKKVVGESKLTFEEFSTVAVMIEACLNSRPLSPMSSNEEDVLALTPGHFLTGSALTAPPEPFEEINEANTVTDKWHLLVLMRNHFWKRWRREVLQEMQQRAKWFKPNHDFRTGDVVLFKDDLQPPTKWPLAKIIELTTGSDGLSRVATIKTATSEFKRPINRLILLPVRSDIPEPPKNQE